MIYWTVLNTGTQPVCSNYCYISHPLYHRSRVTSTQRYLFISLSWRYMRSLHTTYCENIYINKRRSFLDWVVGGCVRAGRGGRDTLLLKLERKKESATKCMEFSGERVREQVRWHLHHNTTCNLHLSWAMHHS